MRPLRGLAWRVCKSRVDWYSVNLPEGKRNGLAGHDSVDALRSSTFIQGPWSVCNPTTGPKRKKTQINKKQQHPVTLLIFWKTVFDTNKWWQSSKVSGSSVNLKCIAPHCSPAQAVCRMLTELVNSAAHNGDAPVSVSWNKIEMSLWSALNTKYEDSRPLVNLKNALASSLQPEAYKSAPQGLP